MQPNAPPSQDGAFFFQPPRRLSRSRRVGVTALRHGIFQRTAIRRSAYCARPCPREAPKHGPHPDRTDSQTQARPRHLRRRSRPGAGVHPLPARPRPVPRRIRPPDARLFVPGHGLAAPGSLRPDGAYRFPRRGVAAKTAWRPGGRFAGRTCRRNPAPLRATSCAISWTLIVGVGPPLPMPEIPARLLLDRISVKTGRKKGGPRVSRKAALCSGGTVRACRAACRAARGTDYWARMLAFLMNTGCMGTSSNMPFFPVRTPLISSTTRLPSTTAPNTA